MTNQEIREQWEGAAPGWAHWEEALASWMEPATQHMLKMADVRPGARVLDLACGAGSQTLRAAELVGKNGTVVANDIAETMLSHVRRHARAAGLANISTLAGAAEELELHGDGFDAAICRLGLMLFADPASALAKVWRALRPKGKLATVVFSTPAANPFMASTLEIVLRHAGKPAPRAGEPGIFALGAEGAIGRSFEAAGFVAIEQRKLSVPLRMASATQALAMMQQAFGAYRAILGDCSENERRAAWQEVHHTLESFETASGFVGPAEVVVASGAKPDRASATTAPLAQ